MSALSALTRFSHNYQSLKAPCKTSSRQKPEQHPITHLAIKKLIDKGDFKRDFDAPIALKFRKNSDFD